MQLLQQKPRHAGSACVRPVAVRANPRCSRRTLVKPQATATAPAETQQEAPQAAGQSQAKGYKDALMLQSFGCKYAQLHNNQALPGHTHSTHSVVLTLWCMCLWCIGDSCDKGNWYKNLESKIADIKV